MHGISPLSDEYLATLMNIVTFYTVYYFFLCVCVCGLACGQTKTTVMLNFIG